MTNEKPARRIRRMTFREKARISDAAHLADLEREHPGGRYPETDGPDDDGRICIRRRERLGNYKPAPAKPGVVVRIVGYDGCMRRNPLEINVPRLRCLEAA